MRYLISYRYCVLILMALTIEVFGAEESAAKEEPAPGRRMVVTVDDLPTGPPGWHTPAEKLALTDKLIATLNRHQVPAIGFVNEDKLEVDGVVDRSRVALLEKWLDAGFELGNHGYSHLDLHRVEAKVWSADVLLGERVLRPLLAKTDREPRYFRHPFLHTGRSLEVKKQTTAFLAEHGYRIAPVTIDNQEWIFGRAYHDAGLASARKERIGAAYVDYMLNMVRYYEQQSVAITGEEIPQVLLIHAYSLNADWLDKLLSSIVQRGYRFVELDEALEHPAYQSEDTFTGSGGITWLHRWAITRGMPGATFVGEPELPDWLQ